MRNSTLTGLAVALLVSLGAVADTLTLKDGHPTRYVVKKGDTLWDISGRFLEEPWRWPQIWEVNPQIKNPHLIYPGDELVLDYSAGKPVLRVRRGPRPVVKLSPTVRSGPSRGKAIPTIPVDAIRQFLHRPIVVSEGELDRAPYIVSLGTEALIGRAGAPAYVRGVQGADGGDRYTVYRQGRPYVDPTSGEDVILGYEALHVADAVVDSPGDPTTMRLTRSNREVLVGDRVLPVGEEEIHRNFMPRAPGRAVDGRIISVVDGVTQIGQYQVVVLNLGTRDGLAPGHVMAVYQTGETIVDPYAEDPEAGKEQPSRIELDPEKQGGVEGFAQAATDLVVAVQEKLVDTVEAINPRPEPYQEVKLPDVRAGTIMVFRPFERMSYALVMEAVRPMHVLDSVKNP